MRPIEELKSVSKECRRILIRMTYDCKMAVHLGGSLSAMDMAIAVYDRYINNFKDELRSRFVLSKGHVVAMLYAILSYYKIISGEELKSLKNTGSLLQGHPDINKIPETEMNTGLLGQGLSVAMGMAYARRLSGNRNKIFVLCGDGEMHEGQIWEASLQAAHFKLDNLVAIIDNNGLSSHDPVNEVINLGSLKDKFKSFNWDIITVEDGNSINEVVSALDKMETLKGKPIAILMKTIKGKGVSFLENEPESHSCSFKESDYKKAMEELS